MQMRSEPSPVIKVLPICKHPPRRRRFEIEVVGKIAAMIRLGQTPNSRQTLFGVVR